MILIAKLPNHITSKLCDVIIHLDLMYEGKKNHLCDHLKNLLL